MDKINDYPNIAVLFAAYNGEKFIERQIHSILSQKKVNINIYISLDRSIDKSIDICTSLEKKHSNIFFINKNKNDFFGSAAKNFYNLFLSVNFESYDYISLSDQDDIWKPYKIFNGYNFIKSSNYMGYSSNVRPFQKKKLLKVIDKSFPQTEYDYLFEGGGAGNTYLILKKVAISFQNFLKLKHDKILKFNHHDWLLYAYTRSKFGSWHISKTVDVLYRQHSENELGTNFTFRGFIKRLKTVLNGYAISQARLIYELLEIDDDFISKIFRKNFMAGIYQIIYFYKFRRSPIGKIAFIFVGIINVFRMNK